MTTKYRIILGFLIMNILLAVLGFFGYIGLQDSSSRFEEFRRLARLDVKMSDANTAIGFAAFETSNFTFSRDMSNYESAMKYVATFEDELKQAETYAAKESTRSMVEKMNAGVVEYKRHLESGKSDILETYATYEKKIGPSLRKIAVGFNSVTENAQRTGNSDTLSGIISAWPKFTLMTTLCNSFAQNRRDVDAVTGRKALDELKEMLVKIEKTIDTKEGLEALKSIATELELASDNFNYMVKVGKEASNEIATLNSKREELINQITEINGVISSASQDFGTEALAANASIQRYMTMLSVGGVLVGVLFAMITIVSLVRVLGDLGRFANAISLGDFNYKLNVKEGGEIGLMVSGMRKIPEVLKAVVNQAADLSDNILSGRFRNRLETKNLAGSFSDLAKAVNDVAGAYTGVMDAMPLPMMSCDTNMNIIFLNAPAQSVLGGDHCNTTCHSQFNAPECNTPDCIGACAMAKKGPHYGETTIHVRGQRVEVNVNSLPLQNNAGKIVGYMEILTDVTDAKDRQRTMAEVARNASEISDRVAASSEELSAQVEQVSRGAELQRARVESTASAMSEMNSTVLEVARSAGQASDQSEKSRQKAEEGAHLVNNVVSSINTVNKVAMTLQDNMHELGNLAEGIGGVMNVISDIADQTNLLALNAAIEAARAGEAGRGFAVVADEVRKLAEKTMTATQEVGTSISAIQSSARTNIDEVSLAVKSISEATDLANSSGSALKEIVDLAGSSSAVVSSIATAAEEQSATSEEISRAIDEINRIVSETTDGMVQSSAAVQDLSHLAQELRSVMSALR